jgi:hypothetical protein
VRTRRGSHENIYVCGTQSYVLGWAFVHVQRGDEEDQGPIFWRNWRTVDKFYVVKESIKLKNAYVGLPLTAMTSFYLES